MPQSKPKPSTPKPLSEARDEREQPAGEAETAHEPNEPPHKPPRK